MSIRSWWKKHVSDPRRRRYLRSLHDGLSWRSFQTVVRDLNDVLMQIESGKMKNPWGAICDNAGFLTGSFESRQACRTFLAMAWLYNKEVRGVRMDFSSFSWPFHDVDAKAPKSEVSYWDGSRLNVRVDCIVWILVEIERHGLHRP